MIIWGGGDVGQSFDGDWVSKRREKEQRAWFTSMLFGKIEQKSMNVKMCPELPHRSVHHIVSKPTLSSLAWSYLLACLRMAWTGSVIILRLTCMTYIWEIGENWRKDKNPITCCITKWERVREVWWKWRAIEGEGGGVVLFGWKQTSSKLLLRLHQSMSSHLQPARIKLPHPHTHAHTHAHTDV